MVELSKMKKGSLIVWIVCCCTATLFAQEEKEKKTQLNGYVKQMGIVTFADDLATYDNLVHNRLNFKWRPNNEWTIALEARNRLFNGYKVENIPMYAELLEFNNDYLDLSWTPIDNGNTILHLMLDRAYVKYFKEQLELTIGRQRINWGKTLVWNPNDLFNTYSFFDFDYEEMPGSDAFRASYYWGISSSVDFAIKMADNWEDFVGAANYQFNIKSYDIQILGGYHKRDATVGVGWAGYLGQGGFKGEASYFTPVYKKTQSYEAFLCTVSYDYSFKSSLYLNVSAIYNSAGEANPGLGIVGDALSLGLTPKTLTSYNISTFVQGMYQFHPLVFGGMSLMYQPQDQSTFISPVVTISAKQNLDVDLIGQAFLGESNDKYQPIYHSIFIRGKWSF